MALSFEAFEEKINVARQGGKQLDAISQVVHDAIEASLSTGKPMVLRGLSAQDRGKVKNRVASIRKKFDTLTINYGYAASGDLVFTAAEKVVEAPESEPEAAVETETAKPVKATRPKAAAK